MEIKFTVPGPPKGNVTLHQYCNIEKVRASNHFACTQKWTQIARVGSTQAASIQG